MTFLHEIPQEFLLGSFFCLLRYQCCDVFLDSDSPEIGSRRNGKDFARLAARCFSAGSIFRRSQTRFPKNESFQRTRSCFPRSKNQMSQMNRIFENSRLRNREWRPGSFERVSFSLSVLQRPGVYSFQPTRRIGWLVRNPRRETSLPKLQFCERRNRTPAQVVGVFSPLLSNRKP